MSNVPSKKPVPTAARPVADRVMKGLQLHQRALLLEDEHKYEEAIALQLKAATLAPQVPKIRVELALFLMRRGELGPGFFEYEWRWRLKDRIGKLPKLGVPQWNGMRIPHGRVALIADQGAGDRIQFARYIPWVAERCREVWMIGAPATAGLFKGFPGLTGVVSAPKDLPPVDMACPLSTLPLVFGTTIETIPGNVPYLEADPAKVSAWKKRLDEKCPAGNLRVGLSWAGNPSHVKDQWRSTRLEQWDEILNVPGVNFVSLQKLLPDADRERLASEKRVLDLTSEIGDFADTAALIQNLDLVVSVDTSVVHLAGAMAKPAWVLLQWVPDWRWLLDREDSPWYPTLRLFRQEAKDNYAASLRRVAEELRTLVAGDRTRLQPRK